MVFECLDHSIPYQRKCSICFCPFLYYYYYNLQDIIQHYFKSTKLRGFGVLGFWGFGDLVDRRLCSYNADFKAEAGVRRVGDR